MRPVSTEVSAADSAPFVSDPIDGMYCGTIELSVPLRADVIQVGAGGDADVGRIRVAKGPGSITVIRVDGLPIQVDFVCDSPEGVPAVDDQQGRARVFLAPVPELRLVGIRDRSGRAYWCLVGGLVVAGRVGLVKQFVDVIGTFAMAKQQVVRDVSTHNGGVATTAG